MSRVTNAPASRKRRKRRLNLASGYYGARSKLFRTATETVDRSQAQAFNHRRKKKGDYRSLWTIRLNTACREQGITYSRFIEGMTKANITLNRKMLSEIAIHDPEGFATIVESVKAQLLKTA